jgi:hypothetical protein
MNPLDHHLARLFRAAAEVRRPAPADAPWSLEARVLAQLRSEAAGLDEFLPLPLFRRALMLSCVLVLVALAFNFRELTQRPPDEVVIINSPVAVNDLP